MKRVWMGVPMAMAIAGVATLAAQTPGAGAQVDNQSQQKQGMVTVVGCLQKGDDARGSTATGPSATGAAGQAEFVLANARMSGRGLASGTATPGAPGERQTQGTAGTAGTTGTADRANANMSMKYMLEGRSDELAKHVGHQIEVTGSMDSSSESAQGHGAGAQGQGTTGAAGRTDEPRGGTTTAPRSSTGAQASADHAERLQVSSIRMISANCEK